jgi:hypothetical protein
MSKLVLKAKYYDCVTSYLIVFLLAIFLIQNLKAKSTSKASNEFIKKAKQVMIAVPYPLIAQSHIDGKSHMISAFCLITAII